MAQLVDIYGRPLKREALKTTQSVRVAERLRIYPDHPSRGLNIRKLPRILEAAERGYLPAQAMLFADMEERDGTICSPRWKSAKSVADAGLVGGAAPQCLEGRKGADRRRG